MTYSIVEPAPASIEILEAAAGAITITEAQPCIITIDEARPNAITVQQPAPAVVSITAPAVASLTISQPTAAVTVLVNETGAAVTTFAQRDYLGGIPTYVNGVLTRVDYSDGTARLFTYYPSGLLRWIDYLAPNQATLRKTIAWNADGTWASTSAPVVI